jgi:beta-ribofuranosylaminobenzene 5'-phosphate synthase
VATDDVDTFGETVGEISRLNGAWYADEQGGVFRPPVGRLVESLDRSPAILGAGQSSWGPTTYGVTTTGAVDAAESAAREALDSTGVDGAVSVVEPNNDGATVEFV